jgi:hypothetical protein
MERRVRTDGGPVVRTAAERIRGSFDPEELRRRNPNAVAMDVLYLLTTAFFAYLALQGTWPAVIAAIPLATLLYFGGKSSPPFFFAQLLLIVLTVLADTGGLIPV